MFKSHQILNLLVDALTILRRGLKLVQSVVKSSLVRRIKASGSTKVVTKFESHKMQREIRTESGHGEYPAAVSHEWDPAILEYYPQPCQLKFEVTGEQGELHAIDHTPDFLLIRKDGVFLVECKTEARLQGASISEPVGSQFLKL